MALESCIHALLLFFGLYLKIYSLPDSSFNTFCSPVGWVFLLFLLTQAETGILDSGNLSAQSLVLRRRTIVTVSAQLSHSDRYFWFLLHWRQLKSVVSSVRSASRPRSHRCFHWDFPTALNKDFLNQITFLFSFAFVLRLCLFQNFFQNIFENLECLLLLTLIQLRSHQILKRNDCFPWTPMETHFVTSSTLRTFLVRMLVQNRLTVG